MPADPLIRAAELARAFLETAADRPVGVPVDREALRRTLGGPLPDGIDVLNEVCLNQALVRFGDDDERTREVIRRVQEDGTAWLGGTTWQGRAAMRISVSSHATTEDDAHRTVAAVLAAWRG